MSVSVVMVTYHTGPILARAIESALSQQGVQEVILVDNGNRKEVQARLDAFAKREPRLKILRGQGNVGFARACNMGAKAANGDYLLLLNPDSVAPSNGVAALVEAFRQYPEAWLAGCTMTTADGAAQGGSKRHLLTPRTAITELLSLWRVNPQKYPRLNIDESPNETEAQYVPAISGALMLMRRERYLQLGGMDEDYFFHVEDLDLCLRVNKAGGKVLYVPTVRVVHYRSTSKVSTLFVEWHKARGFVHYFNKHFHERYNLAFRVGTIGGIYARLAVRSVWILLKEFISFKNRSAEVERHERQVQLLETPLGRRYMEDRAVHSHDPVLVVGGTGQVGISIIRRLLASDIKTGVLYHTHTVDYVNRNLTWIQGSLTSETLDLNGYQPKTVICTAAIWLLPQHIKQLAELGVKRVICFSSTSIMGKSSSKNRYEKELVSRFISAENAIRQQCEKYGIAWTVFRPTMIYGIGLDRNVCSIRRFIDRFGFFPLTDPGTGLRAPVHTDDLANAVMTSLPLSTTYNKCYSLGGGEQITYIAMVERIAKNMNKPARIIRTKYLPLIIDIFSFITRNPDTNGEIAVRMNSDLVFDDSEARQDFGYAPRAFLTQGPLELGIEVPVAPKFKEAA
ncbi:MAG: glycosyltransferase [Proteobacteria bacterium]|nr:glycosyltransferase [Pseudomonadota bacterium]